MVKCDANAVSPLNNCFAYTHTHGMAWHIQHTKCVTMSAVASVASYVWAIVCWLIRVQFSFKYKFNAVQCSLYGFSFRCERWKERMRVKEKIYSVERWRSNLTIHNNLLNSIVYLNPCVQCILLCKRIILYHWDDICSLFDVHTAYCI